MTRHIELRRTACTLAAAMTLACLPSMAPGGTTQAELNAAAGSSEWLLPNHSYAGHRHSPLTQINPANAGDLRAVCLFNPGDINRFASNPLVVDGFLYLTSGDTTFALDASNCRLKWRHDWKPKSKQSEYRTPTATINPFKSRGLSIKDGRLLRATSDSHLLALSADTGAALWDRRIADAQNFELVTMAPLAFEDLVIAGIGIGEFGTKGWIGAFRLSDGEPVWRFNTVPDAGEPGSESWTEISWCWMQPMAKCSTASTWGRPSTLA